jgi:hypothetical protein
METLTISEWNDEELLLVVPRDKVFPNKSVSYHLKMYGYSGIGEILWKVLDHKDTYAIDNIVDINANVGYISLIGLMNGKKTYVFESNGSYQRCIEQSLVKNCIEKGLLTFGNCKIGVSTAVVKKTPLSDIIPNGALLVRIAFANGEEMEILNSAQFLLQNALINLIMLELQVVKDERLHRTNIQLLLSLVRDYAFALYHFDQDDSFQKIDDFDIYLSVCLRKKEAYNNNIMRFIAVHQSFHKVFSTCL